MIVSQKSFDVLISNEEEQKKSAENDFSKSSSSVVPQKIESANTLKVLRGWNEIAERAAAGDMAVLGFMRQGKAFKDDSGKVYIRFPNDFALSMVNKAPHNENIRAAICLNLQRTISESEIVFGIIDGDEQEDNDLDDLNF